MNFTSTRGALSLESLRRLVPSAFAEAAHESRSDRYTFIPTIQVIDRLMTEGWVPVRAQQNRVKVADRKDFTKHMIRFRRDGQPVMVGDTFPEVVLTNAHDGASSYLMDAGLFRLACSNGLCVADGTFESIRVPHRGNIVDNVIEASYRVIGEAPMLAQEVKNFREVEVSPLYRQAFAEAALQLRYPDEVNEDTGKLIKTAPIEPRQLLQVRRWADRDEQNNLWGTLNVVQENMLQGGVRGRSASGRRMSTRAVNSVTEDTRLNKALWTLASEMRKILAGG